MFVGLFGGSKSIASTSKVGPGCSVSLPTPRSNDTVALCLRSRSHHIIAGHIISVDNKNSWTIEMPSTVTASVSLPIIDNGELFATST